MIGGATWLLTGGSGFFAQHFARYLLDHASPHAVRLLSRSEAKLVETERALDDSHIRRLVGDVRDLERLKVACRGVDYLCHAAALKRVEVCESDPWEAIATNVTGTQHVASACLAAGVQRAILLSTDKAAVPDTTYGTTKLLAERLWVQGNVYAAGLPTRFAVTRYGNVIGSTGSVIPTWIEQAKTGTICLTDPQATRFWMRPQDAVQLVLRAFETMRGGETFLPKLQAASLETVAQAVAPAATQTVTGLRGMEKMHEVLLSEAEQRRTRELPYCYVMVPTQVTWEEQRRWQSGKDVTVPLSSRTAPQLTVEQFRAMLT